MKIRTLLPVLAMLLLSACSVFDTPREAKITARNLTDQGYQLLAQDKARASIPLFDKAIASDRHNMRAYQGKGIALNHLGRHEEAETVYEQGLKIEPDAVGLTNNLAMSRILRGKYQAAIDLIAPLARSEQDNDTVQENLALANCLLGKREDARKLYSKRLPPAEVENNLNFCSKYDVLRKRKEKKK